MDTRATATMYDGTKISGWLTTEHAASSYGQPVFVGKDGQAYDWISIAEISTAAAMGAKTSERKAAAARANGIKGGPKGGRPRKQPKE